MIPILKIVLTILQFWGVSALSFVCWLLSPLKWSQRSILSSKINKLTYEAVESLNCNAKSSIVYLPDTDIKLHVVEAGHQSEKLVVLLHGFPENWHSWKNVIPVLAKKGYFVVAVDMRGYNLSDKVKGVSNYNLKSLTGDVLALIKYYGKKTAYAVVGHDWGGVVAWHFAIHHSDSLDKLVVLNSPHPSAFLSAFMKSWDQRLASWYMIFFQIPVLPESLFSFFGDRIIRAMYQDKILKGDLEYSYSALLQPGALHATINYYRAMLRGAFRRKGSGVSKSTVNTPTLVIWGLGDVALTRDVSDPSRWVPNLRTNYLPNAGHFVLNDAPDEVNNSLLAFL
eukprot:TRINITY_DN310_c0_g2_i1.p1 TRINITY_DN310_c0_g2~~TRINITY_DN310_c0_g2_i1.p1  ORF type:complete len:339 (-),score=42.61 TRINITY_DN310_c0_g2_i1:185-1201(-)